ncbi:hypothetical protein [uncultured Aquimarina sp.]|uniref:beta strand repeat-containing protein n=1 Tax=uncultured Aquimarina sp. TaxID=575652 RepID=UPI00261F6F16|nr:hypothetical protein [uncultured Aquimarina sp.]
MKKNTPLLILLFFSLFGFSQSFNYQAVVRDANGDPIVNQSIGVQIQILEGVAPDNLVYTEIHTVTSTAQGIISLAVGTGTTSDNFSTINWSQQNQWIGIAVDITGGTTYTSIGTTKLQQVPYALYAANSGDKTFDTTNNVTSNASGTIATDDFVFGSSQLDNITNNTDDNARVFFDKSKAALRAGIVNDVEEGTPVAGDLWNDANVGYGSIALGVDNAAKAFGSVAIGNENTIETAVSNSITLGSGNTINGNALSAFILGEVNTVSGIHSLALGANNNAGGNGNIAMGRGLTTNNKDAIALGYFNTEISGSPTGYNVNQPLLIVGNGTDQMNTSNALVIRHNGNTLLNGALTIDGDNTGSGIGYTLPSQDGTANQVMSTDGAGNVSWINAPSGGAFSTTSNVTSNANGTIAIDDFVFGSTQLDDDTNTTDDDFRMFFDKSKGAFRAGSAVGTEWDNVNVGAGSVAFGNKNTVSGFQSFSVGVQNNVIGATSATFGANNTITGIGTFSTGEFLTAEARSQVTIGYLNTAAAGNALIKVPTDRLFVIGNGFDEANRSDALVMLKNGNTMLNGSLTIDGDNQGTGQAYTLPAQDGTANQVMSTDGSGNVSWITQPATPSVTFSTVNNVTSNANGNIAADNFVFGSTQLNDIENNASDDVKMYFDKSKGSFRAGTSLDSSGDAFVWNPINAGDYSVAMGRYSLAQGIAATAFGTNNNAGGENAFAAGFQNLASRPSTVAIGANNSVSGFYAVGIGRGTQSTTYGQHTIGLFSEFVNGSDAAYVATDPLFIIGNGISDINRTNALVMRKNGNTQLNGSLTIDGDNAGAGTAYTLPAQDGTANQVMTTDGSGNVSWTAVSGNDADADPTNEIELPAGGTDGQILRTNGSGGYTWVNDAVNDADNDPTNEIELPAGGISGQVLTSNGAGGSQWTSNVSAATVETPALTITGLPAFAADLDGTKVLSGAGSFVGLTGWRTSDGALPKNLFDNGNHFNETTGEFTAPVNGFYYFTAQIRFDQISSGYFRLLLGVNGTTSLNNGLHAISEGDATGTQFHTLNVGGVMKLNANDKVNIIVFSSSDASWSVSDESGFNGYLISRF